MNDLTEHKELLKNFKTLNTKLQQYDDNGNEVYDFKAAWRTYCNQRPSLKELMDSDKPRYEFERSLYVAKMRFSFADPYLPSKLRTAFSLVRNQ
ncbi:hypothetical protein VCHA38O209_50265 [Vibrio chagasii]|nr:hypothetical protein VCHA38O209_50265 [Vibrio chagasii]